MPLLFLRVYSGGERRKPIVEEAFPADLRQEWINMQRAVEKTKKRNRNKKIRQKVLKDFMKGAGK